MKYRNPVIPGFYPDPSVCRKGDDYYLVTSSFEYFPGIPVFHSRDLVHWRQIGHCLTRGSQLNLKHAKSSDGLYAPTIRYHDGLFYMITTNTTGNGHFYVYTDDPAGEWSEPVAVEGPGFDPDLFFDDDGKVYFSREDIGGYGIRSWEIDIQSGRLMGDEHLIWEGFEDRLCEAPHIYRIGEKYYLFVAEGGTHFGHMIVAARSDHPLGPYEGCPHNPVFTHRHLPEHPVQATGHADIIQDSRGRWWALFLGVRVVDGKHHLGRETFLAPLEWTPDGWPLINGGNAVALEMEAELPALHPLPPEPALDHFDDTRLPLRYQFRGNPDPEKWSLSQRPGFLTLHGGPENLSAPLCPGFLGLRQRHFRCRAEAVLDFQPDRDDEEAGITVLQNHQNHYDLARFRSGGENYLILRACRKGRREVLHREPCGDGVLTLSVAADERSYRFSWNDGGEDHPLPVALPTADLSTEEAGGFTGVFFGMYTSGNGAFCSVPAYFDSFRYEADDEAATRDNQMKGSSHEGKDVL